MLKIMLWILWAALVVLMFLLILWLILKNRKRK